MLVGALSIAILPALQLHGAGAALPPGGTFHALTPSRILDTRLGTPVGAGGTLNVPITIPGGVTSASVSAVVINVTVTNSSATSYLTLYPGGGSLPLASNLNWSGGQTVAKLVTVGLGTGAVNAFNAKGSVDIIFDLAGYYSTPAASPGPDGLFNPLVPARLSGPLSASGRAAWSLVRLPARRKGLWPLPQPVRERLLLVLPDGELYEYLCTACGESVGKRKLTGAPLFTG